MTIKLLKEKSKRNLKGNKFTAALAVIILLLIGIIISSIYFLSAQIGNNILLILGMIISIVIFAFIKPGYSSIFLTISRNNKTSINEMFNKGFLFKKSLIIQIILFILEFILSFSFIMLILFLYSKTLGNAFIYYSDRIMLFGNVSLSSALKVTPYITIPLILILIIMILAYSMPYYFLLDNPTFSSIKCFRASRKMMRHNKFKLFRIYLSFILWYIFGYITLGIAYLYIIPYLNVTIANLYDVLKGSYNDSNSKVINNNFNNIMFNDSAEEARNMNAEILDNYKVVQSTQKANQSNEVEVFDIQKENK